MGKIFGFVDENRRSLMQAKRQELKEYIDPETNKIFDHMARKTMCPICDVDDALIVFEKQGFNFVKCRQCGLLYVNPQLRSDVLESVYRKSSASTAWIQVQKGTREQEWNFKNKYFPALEELQRLRPQGGRLLDVGCSIGQFLKASSDFGWEGEGIELNEEAVRFGREEYGLKIYNQRLEDIGLDAESYDLISLWGVLEHLSDPNEMLRMVRDFLTNDGLLLIFVPNAHSLIIRLSRSHNSTVSGRSHLWYFSPSTIGKILKKNGFSKVSEFSVLPQIHEVVHFLQYNRLYEESEMKCAEEIFLEKEEARWLAEYVNRRKMGYKLITIAAKETDV